MRQKRSGPEPAIHPLAALAVTAVGILAMYLPLAAGWRLGIRPGIALGSALLATPALLTLALAPRVRRPTVGRPIDLRTASLSLALAAALWIGSIGVVALQALVRPPAPGELEMFRQIFAALAPANVLDGIVSVTVIAILPAMSEELVLRGVLLSSLAIRVAPALSLVLTGSPSHRLGRALAVVFTAAVFAVIHDPIRLLFAFTLGVAFGFVRLRTDSLWPCVVAHATLNTLTFFLAPLVDDPSKPYTPEPLLGFAALATGIALSWPLLRRLRSAPGAA